ncbi:MAG: hypothetical protein AB4368_00290 [Xenococcaceae cyanobacterium]
MEHQNTSPWDTNNNFTNAEERASVESKSSDGNSIINAERYATLTGFDRHKGTKPSEESSTENTEDVARLLETEENSLSNPYTARTLHSFSSHPIPKIILVFGTVLIAVSLAGTILNSGNFKQTAQTENENQEPEPSITSNDATESDDRELEKGELLTEIALAEQKKQLEALDEPKARSTPSPSPPPSNPKPKPASAPPKVIYRNVPVSAPIPAPLDVPKSEPIEPQIDPQEAWIAATKIGNYGTVTSISTQPQNNLALAQSNFLEGNSNNSSSPPRDRLAQKTNVSTQQILIGSKAKAVLTNSIVWDNSSTDQRTLVFRLEEPLKNRDGSIVIPKDTQIIASIKEVSSGGVVDLEIHSALLLNQGSWQELPLPSNSLYVQGEKGKPLLAKSFSHNNSLDWGGLATEAVGTAAVEADLPGGRNLPRVIDRLSPSRSRSSPTSAYWLLKENTEVEILVERSFSLPMPKLEEEYVE